MNINGHKGEEDMFVIERHQRIMDILEERKSVSVSELSKAFFIGEATIRRDLEKLEGMGLLKRTYGGAVLLRSVDYEIPLSVREAENKAEKDHIGRLAGDMVRDGDTIIMDSSSTILRMVPYLKGKKELTVITNGAKTAIELGQMRGVKVYCTGGILRENSLSYIGEPARRCMEGFYANILFFSCRGVSMEKGLTDPNEEEAELRRIMIGNSRRQVLLCDSTKFGASSFCKIGGMECVSDIVTDSRPGDDWDMFLREKGINLIL